MGEVSARATPASMATWLSKSPRGTLLRTLRTGSPSYRRSLHPALHSLHPALQSLSGWTKCRACQGIATPKGKKFWCGSRPPRTRRRFRLTRTSLSLHSGISRADNARRGRSQQSVAVHVNVKNTQENANAEVFFGADRHPGDICHLTVRGRNAALSAASGIERSGSRKRGRKNRASNSGTRAQAGRANHPTSIPAAIKPSA